MAGPLADRRATRLAIVGASARAAAFSALRAGFEVVTADLFADEDLCRRCPATRIDNYPEGLAAWLAEQDVDAWMYTGALENNPDLVDRMAAIRPLWGNRGEALRRCRDPFELLRQCSDHGVSFPDTAPEPRGLALDGRWLAKTYSGANGVGVWRLSHQSSISNAIIAGAVYQSFVSGLSASAVFMIGDDECNVLGVTQQLIGEPRYGAAQWAYCGSINRPDFNATFAGELAQIGEMLGHAFGLRGIVGVDLIADSNRVWLIEVNPRYTASIEVIERSGISVATLHARCFGFPAELVDITTGFGARAKAVLYAKRDFVFDETLAEWAMRESLANRMADIPSSETAFRQGQPVVTVLVDADVDDAHEQLSNAVDRVESRLYDRA